MHGFVGCGRGSRSNSAVISTSGELFTWHTSMLSSVPQRWGHVNQFRGFHGRVVTEVSCGDIHTAAITAGARTFLLQMYVNLSHAWCRRRVFHLWSRRHPATQSKTIAGSCAARTNRRRARRGRQDGSQRAVGLAGPQPCRHKRTGRCRQLRRGSHGTGADYRNAVHVWPERLRATGIPPICLIDGNARI